MAKIPLDVETAMFRSGRTYEFIFNFEAGIGRLTPDKYTESAIQVSNEVRDKILAQGFTDVIIHSIRPLIAWQNDERVVTDIIIEIEPLSNPIDLGISIVVVLGIIATTFLLRYGVDPVIQSVSEFIDKGSDVVKNLDDSFTGGFLGISGALLILAIAIFLVFGRKFAS